MAQLDKPPTFEEAMDFIRGRVAAEIGIVVALVPTISRDKLNELVEALSREQFDISTKIMPNYLGDKVAEYPLIQVHIKNVETGVEGFLSAYKRLEAPQVDEDPQQALFSALVLAFLNSPAARFLLKANGYDYRFVQAPDQDQTPKIVM